MDLTATTGTLTDGATTSYSNNLACEWRIASGGVVELTFTVFRVWTGDVVEVFDGSALVAKLHGFDRAWPPLRATGDMTVKFTTDGVTERAFNYVLTDGWSATYDAAASACDATYCGAHGTCGASGLCTCDAGYGGADCSLATCLGTTTLTKTSLRYIDMPTQTVIKSAKLLPVMLGSVVLLQKRYRTRDWVAALMLCAGVGAFNASTSWPSLRQTELGVACIVTALLCDALPMAEHGRYAYLLDTDGFKEKMRADGATADLQRWHELKVLVVSRLLTAQCALRHSPRVLSL